MGFQGGGGSCTFAKPLFHTGVPGARRQVPDISMLADPFTGGEVIITLNGELRVGAVGVPAWLRRCFPE